jgi:hypothetical protein
LCIGEQANDIKVVVGDEVVPADWEAFDLTGSQTSASSAATVRCGSSAKATNQR